MNCKFEVSGLWVGC